MNDDESAPLEGELVDASQGPARGRPTASGQKIPARTLVGRIFDDACALVIALRDPRTGAAPKYATALMLVYLISPVDIVPDVMPLLGIADDALIVPLMAQGALRLVPREVRDEAEARVASGAPRRRAVRWMVAIAVIWLAILAVGVLLLWKAFGER